MAIVFAVLIIDIVVGLAILISQMRPDYRNPKDGGRVPPCSPVEPPKRKAAPKDGF